MKFCSRCCELKDNDNFCPNSGYNTTNSNYKNS